MIDIILDREFKSVIEGNMALEGIPTMDYTFTDVKDNELFTDRTIIDGVEELYFIHELFVSNG